MPHYSYSYAVRHVMPTSPGQVKKSTVPDTRGPCVDRPWQDFIDEVIVRATFRAGAAELDVLVQAVLNPQRDRLASVRELERWICHVVPDRALLWRYVHDESISAERRTALLGELAATVRRIESQLGSMKVHASAADGTSSSGQESRAMGSHPLTVAATGHPGCPAVLRAGAVLYRYDFQALGAYVTGSDQVTGAQVDVFLQRRGAVPGAGDVIVLDTGHGAGMHERMAMIDRYTEGVMYMSALPMSPDASAVVGDTPDYTIDLRTREGCDRVQALLRLKMDALTSLMHLDAQGQGAPAASLVLDHPDADTMEMVLRAQVSMVERCLARLRESGPRCQGPDTP